MREKRKFWWYTSAVSGDDRTRFLHPKAAVSPKAVLGDDKTNFPHPEVCVRIFCCFMRGFSVASRALSQPSRTLTLGMKKGRQRQRKDKEAKESKEKLNREASKGRFARSIQQNVFEQKCIQKCIWIICWWFKQSIKITTPQFFTIYI